MKWKKLGLIFCPNENYDWMMSHASVPFADWLFDDTYRIYFSTRDQAQRSFVAHLDISIQNKEVVLNLASSPLLAPGKIGSFDEDGCMLSWITTFNDIKYYYYIGWNKGHSVPFRNAIGLAIGDVDGIQKYGEGPILDRSIHDPCFTASSCILREQNIWHMWYLSGIKWENKHNSIIPYYNIKYAHSKDGISWERTGITCISFKDEEEHAISRPCVIKDNSIYKMWYSYRGKTYRIGYAESTDGINWQRMDHQVGIESSLGKEWDSDMIAYPFVFDHKGLRYMLYNGNQYGKSGFGLAVLDR